MGFSPILRYSHRHSHFQALQLSSRSTFNALGTLPYHSCKHESAISVLCLAPVHLRRSVTRLVSYYALFKGWLLLSQPPSCFDNSNNGIRSLITISTPRWGHHIFSALPPLHLTSRLGLNLFRGEPAISEFVWNFTASHKSSAHVSGYVGSVLQHLLRYLQPAHG